IVDYNCKVYFNEKPEDLVVCRHISLQYCIDSMNENTGKVPLKECYSTPEGIQQHFPYELDQQFDNLINNPPPGT
ncbi:ShET2/EspL2 family type III secretion system effector toxin, partial [Escherichia coli]